MFRKALAMFLSVLMIMSMLFTVPVSADSPDGPAAPGVTSGYIQAYTAPKVSLFEGEPVPINVYIDNAVLKQFTLYHDKSNGAWEVGWGDSGSGTASLVEALNLGLGGDATAMATTDGPIKITSASTGSTSCVYVEGQAAMALGFDMYTPYNTNDGGSCLMANNSGDFTNPVTITAGAVTILVGDVNIDVPAGIYGNLDGIVNTLNSFSDFSDVAIAGVHTSYQTLTIQSKDIDSDIDIRISGDSDTLRAIGFSGTIMEKGTGLAVNDDPSALPKQVLTTMNAADYTSNSAMLVTADKYYLYTPDDTKEVPAPLLFNAQIKDFGVYEQAAQEGKLFAKISLSKNPETYNYIGRDLSIDNGICTISFDNMRDIIPNTDEQYTLYVSVWQVTNTSAPAFLVLQPTPVNLQYVPDGASALASASTININEMQSHISFRIPGNVAEMNDPQISITDSAGKVLAKTVDGLDHNSVSIYSNEVNDDRYEGVFEGSLWIPRYCTTVSGTVFRAANYTEGLYDINLSYIDKSGVNQSTTYDGLIEIIDAPIVRGISEDGKPAFVGGNTITVTLYAEAANKDNFRVDILDENGGVIGHTTGSRYFGKDAFTYTAVLDSPAVFENGKNYYVKVIPVGDIKPVFTEGDTKSFEPTAEFSLYNVSFNGEDGLADFTVSAVLPPQGSVDLGLFHSQDSYNATPIAITTVTAGESMNVEFLDQTEKTLQLESGSYVIRQRSSGNNDWSYNGNGYVWTEGYDSDNASGSPETMYLNSNPFFYYATDTSYAFEFLLSNDKYNLANVKSVSVDLLDSDDVIGTCSSSAITAQAISMGNENDPVAATKYSGNIDITKTNLTEGVYRLRVTLNYQDDTTVSKAFSISGISKDKVYATWGNTKLQSGNAGTTILTGMWMVKGTYEEKDFSYQMTTLMDDPIAISSTTAINDPNEYTYEDYYTVNGSTTAAIDAAFYYLSVKYEGKDIYDLSNPMKLIFSGYNAITPLPAAAFYSGWWCGEDGDSIVGLDIRQNRNNSPVTVQIFKNDDLIVSGTLEKSADEECEYLFPAALLAELSSEVEYDIAVLCENEIIGFLEEAKIDTTVAVKVPVTDITVSPSALNLKIGESSTVSAIISPSDATNKHVTWSSNNTAVATVDSNGKVSTIVTGKATITATTADGSKADTCIVTVSANPATITVDKLSYSDDTAITAQNSSYAVDGAKFTMEQPLKMILKGTEYEATSSYTYSISVGNAQTITGSATSADFAAGIAITIPRVTAMADGTYGLSISVKNAQNEQVASANSTLVLSGTPVPVSTVSMSKSKLIMSIGGASALTATVYPTNATNQKVTWTSDKETVAKVDANGNVTAVGVGDAIITATTEDGAKKATCSVSVGLDLTGTLQYGSNTAAGTWIALYKNNGSTYVNSTMTDANGAFKFAGIKDGSYQLQAYSPDTRYKDLNQVVTITAGTSTGAIGVVSFESKYTTKADMDITVKDQNGAALTGSYNISLYDYNTGVNIWQTYAAGSTDHTISDLPYETGGSSYLVTLYTGEAYDYYSKYELVSLGSNGGSVTFTVPITHKVTGTVKDGNGNPVINTSVYAQLKDQPDSWQTFWGYTDNNGQYTILGLKQGSTYELNLSSNTYSLATKASIVIGDTDTTLNLSATKGMSLKGIVYNGSEMPYKAYLQLTDGSNGQYITGGYAASDGYYFDSAIKKAGTYRLQIQSMFNKNGFWKNFVSSPVTIEVTDGDIAAGLKTVDLSYENPTQNTSIFTGSGNLVLSDVGIVHDGTKLNLIIKYKNNGNLIVPSAEFKVEPPTGMSVAAGQSDTFTVSDLAPGASGQKSIALDVGSITSNYAKIPVTVKISTDQYDIGSATVEVANVTLNGPGAVKTTDKIKVYGEATSNSVVMIKNARTGEVLGTATPNGRWYSAELQPLTAEGTYTLVAQASNGTTTAISSTLTVESKAQQVVIEKVNANSSDSTDLPVNGLIGVRAFTAWVGPDLSGRDITLGVKFTGSDIKSVTYHFSDKDYTGTLEGGFWKTILTGWNGAGLKTIKATVETEDGRTLTFIIAEVTVLVDPSGYIIDKETGDRLEGVTVVCEVLNGSTWEKWNAELYGQINPQTTDAEGNYGWMVPAGTYRVKATLNGYNAYSTMDDSNFSNAGSSTIIVPPVRSDVNFALTPAVAVTGIELNKDTTSIAAGNNETLVVTVTPNDATNAANVNWTSSNTGVATVSASGKVTAVAQGTATITAKVGSIKDTCVVTVTTTSSGGSSTTSGGGGAAVTAPETPVLGKIKSVSADNSGKATVKLADMKDFSNLKVDGLADLVFDKTATDTLKGAAGDLTISITKAENNQLSNEAKTIVGDRPVYEFSVLSGNAKISSFGGGSVQVSVPYELKAGEDQNAIVIYYIDSTGKLAPVSGCIYNPTTKTVTFVTNHFSKFAIGYNKKTFSDVPSWATNYVTYLAARGIIGGIGNDQYGSQNNVTRADFVVMLSRIAGTDLSGFNNSSFTDVSADAYYRQAVEWAAKNGITSGIGGGKFAPNANITRQDMAVMLQKFALNQGITLSATAGQATFADQSSIASYATSAAAAMQKAGVIGGKEFTGKSGQYFAPKDNATRVETTKMLTIVMKSMVE